MKVLSERRPITSCSSNISLYRISQQLFLFIIINTAFLTKNKARLTDSANVVIDTAFLHWTFNISFCVKAHQNAFFQVHLLQLMAILK